MTRLGAAVVAIFLVWPTSAHADLPVWIDTDAACDKEWFHDVDDCWALGLALKSGDLDVRGISTVFGNADIARTHQSALRMLDLSQPDGVLAIHRGAAEATSGESSPAVDAMVTALEQQPLTVLALGPLTNIATLIRNHPQAAQGISQIVAVMGRRPGEVFGVGDNPLMHLHDMNVRKDPEAVRTVLASGIPLTVIAFSASAEIVVTTDDLAQLEHRGGFARELAEISEPWLLVWRYVFWADGFRPFDVLPVLYVMAPEAFDCEQTAADVSAPRAITTYDIALEAGDLTTTSQPILYCDDAAAWLHPVMLQMVSAGGGTVALIREGQSAVWDRSTGPVVEGARR